MKTLDRILVAVDFGVETPSVVDVAARLSSTFRASLQLIYAIEEVPHFESGLDLLKQAADERLAKLQEEIAKRGIVCEPPLTIVGRSFDAVVRAADTAHAHLIVIGRGATENARRTGLGNTVSRVIRRSTKPVLAVGPDFHGAIRRILCPVDGSNASARGLRNAILLARGLDARLTVLTVIAEFSPLQGMIRRPDMAKLASDYQKMERDQFELFLRGFDFGAVSWDKEVHYGHPAEEIARLATSAKYDLIVMGSTGRAGVPRILLGSTAETVCRRVACSVLTVKREDVLSVRLEDEVSDLNRLIDEGRELIEQGNYEEALARFDQCLLRDPYLASAIEGQAVAHEHLGHSEVAADLREQAALIRRNLWEQPEPKEAVPTK